MKCAWSESNGHKIYFDNEDSEWHYSDDKSLFIFGDRPCTKCNHFQTDKGHDYCIRNLPGVKNACCGHGIEDGYIQFNDGRCIRGKFEIEN
jgi:hypothetical protein